jgi:hypothetical protein
VLNISDYAVQFLRMQAERDPRCEQLLVQLEARTGIPAAKARQLIKQYAYVATYNGDAAWFTDMTQKAAR